MPLPAFPKSATKDGLKSAAPVAYKNLKDTTEGKALLKHLESLLAASKPIADCDFVALEAAIKGLDYEKIKKLADAVDDVLGDVKDLREATLKFVSYFNSSVLKKLERNADNDKLVAWAKGAKSALETYAADAKEGIEKIVTKADMLVKKGDKPDAEVVELLRWDLDEIDLVSLLKTRIGMRLSYLAVPARKSVCVSVTGKAGYKAAKNDVLRRDFFMAAHEACEEAARTLAGELREIDKGVKYGQVELDAAPSAMERAFARFETVYAQRSDAAIQKVWREFLKSKADVKGYKIATAAKLAGGVGGVLAGVVKLKLSMLTVVGTPIGVAALGKSLVELVKTVAGSFDTAAELTARIEKDLDTVKATFADARSSGAVIVGKDAAKDVVARLTGVQATTIGSLKASIKDYRDKSQDWNVKGTEAGKLITRALAELEALSRKLETLKRQKADAAIGTVEELKAMEKETIRALETLLDRSEEMKRAYADSRKQLEQWDRKLADLEGKDLAAVSENIRKWAVPVVDLVKVTSVHGAVEKVGKLAAEYAVKARQMGRECDAAVSGGQLILDTGNTALLTGHL